MFRVFFNKDNSKYEAVVYSLNNYDPTRQLKLIENELNKRNFKEGLVLFDLSSIPYRHHKKYLEGKFVNGKFEEGMLRIIHPNEYSHLHLVSKHYLNDPYIHRTKTQEPIWKQHLDLLRGKK